MNRAQERRKVVVRAGEPTNASSLQPGQVAGLVEAASEHGEGSSVGRTDHVHVPLGCEGRDRKLGHAVPSSVGDR